MLIRQTPRIAEKSRVLARSGFTLMEILIVVAIIVVLAGVGTFYLMPMLSESKEQVAYTQAKTISEACQMFEVKHKQRPGSARDLVQAVNGKAPILELDAILDPWGKEFVVDPSGPKNGGLRPDVYTTSPEGKVIGNWSRTQQQQ
jgi:general secretion pathway protein G